MKNLFVLFALFYHPLYGQDSIRKGWTNELEINVYSVNLIHYGGLELDYEFGKRIGAQSELGIKAGIFHIRLRNSNQFSYIPAYLYFRYYFRKHKSSLSLNAGTPLYWIQDDSRIIDGPYWNRDDEVIHPIYRIRIWLINQFEYEYYFKRKFGISVGVTNYLTEVSSSNLTYPTETEKPFRINPGFKLGISYQF